MGEARGSVPINIFLSSLAEVPGRSVELQASTSGF